MKFPDDSEARRVKCPSCGNTFMSSDGTDKPVSRGSKADLEDDRPRKSRRDDDDDRRSRRRDDDDDDRPRKSRRDDDDDDRRSRRRDDDDDDRDVRPRSRRRDDDDEDDRDDRRSRRRRDDDYDDRRSRRDKQALEGQFNRASLACLLHFIGGWLLVGSCALVVFSMFLNWVGVTEGLRVFGIICGILGIGGWLTSATGTGFLVSGPRGRGALGLSIATAATAGFHILLLVLVASTRFGAQAGIVAGAGYSDLNWSAFITQSDALAKLMFSLISSDGDRAYDGAALAVFANLLEVARNILLLLTLRSIMLCARDNKTAKSLMNAVVGSSIFAGGLLVLGLMFGLIVQAMRPTRFDQDAFRNMFTVIRMFLMLNYVAIGALAVWTTLMMRVAKSHIDYRRD